MVHLAVSHWISLGAGGLRLGVARWKGGDRLASGSAQVWDRCGLKRIVDELKFGRELDFWGIFLLVVVNVCTVFNKLCSSSHFT